MTGKRKNIFSKIATKIKNWLIAGLILWVPLIVTFYIIKFIITGLDKVYEALPPHLQPQTLLKHIFPALKGYPIPGIGIVLSLIILLITGLLISNYVGYKIIFFTEKKILEKIPLVRTIYKAMKQISNAILNDSNKSFENVIMIEYPRRDCYSLAFQTSEPFFDKTTKKSLITVYLPTAPNPTSGFTLLIPEEEAQTLNMPVEEALRFIISLGVVIPKDFLNSNKITQKKDSSSHSSNEK